MDDSMKEFQQNLIEVEIEAENLLLGRHQVISTSIRRFLLTSRFSLAPYQKQSTGTKSISTQSRIDHEKVDCIMLPKAITLLVENDRQRNGNREALTALRKAAKTTKSSVPPPFESLMKEIESRPLVKEVCATCGNHDAKEKTWLLFPGTDVFGRVPFHAAHTILEKDQILLDFESKKLQSYVKERSLIISGKGGLADKISPGVLRSLVTLTDQTKTNADD